MHYRIVIHGGSGELGSIWSQILSIGGSVAGQTAQQAGAPNWLSALIGAGGAIGAGLLNQPPSSHQSGCLQRLLTDQGEIAACIDAMHAGWISAARAGATTEQLLQIVTGLYQAVSSDQYFRQSDPYVIQAKGVFGSEVARLTPLVAGGGGSLPGAAPPGAAGTIAGIPLQTALIFAGGGLLLWVLLK
jgi:hypothetical protein